MRTPKGQEENKISTWLFYFMKSKSPDAVSRDFDIHYFILFFLFELIDKILGKEKRILKHRVRRYAV